jgi:hypothetical protein
VTLAIAIDIILSAIVLTAIVASLTWAILSSGDGRATARPEVGKAAGSGEAKAYPPPCSQDAEASVVETGGSAVVGVLLDVGVEGSLAGVLAGVHVGDLAGGVDIDGRRESFQAAAEDVV